MKAKKTYRTTGFIHTLIKEGDSAFIYSKTYSDKTLPKYTSYEIFKKIKPKIRTNGETNEPLFYKLPRNEDFGRWAWCAYTFQGALKRFNLIEQS